MLDQLWALWTVFQHRPSQLHLETRIWMDQHCLDADDLSFTMAALMRDYAYECCFTRE